MRNRNAIVPRRCHERPLRLGKPATVMDRARARAKVTKDRTKAACTKIAEAFTVSTWSGPPAGPPRP